MNKKYKIYRKKLVKNGQPKYKWALLPENKKPSKNMTYVRSIKVHTNESTIQLQERVKKMLGDPNIINETYTNPAILIANTFLENDNYEYDEEPELDDNEIDEEVDEEVDEDEILAQLKSLGLSDDELEQAYNMAKSKSVEEGLKDKLSKAAMLIGTLASLGLANNFDDLHNKMSHNTVNDPVMQSYKMAQAKSSKIDKMADQISQFILHPKLVKGDTAKYGHEKRINDNAYSLDLGVKDSDKELLKNLEQANKGIINLAVAKALKSHPELVKQMNDAGFDSDDIQEVAQGAVHFVLK